MLRKYVSHLLSPAPADGGGGAPAAPAPAAPAAPAGGTPPAAAPEKGSQSPTGRSAIDDFAAEIAGVTPPPADPAKPPEPDKGGDPAKGPDKGDEPPPPGPDGEVDWSKAPKKWFKIYEDHKKKTAGKIADLEGQIKKLADKPAPTPADNKKIEEYETKIKELEGRFKDTESLLAQADYTKSNEYKTRHLDPMTRAYQDAVKELTQLTVKDGETERPATKADVDRLLRMSGVEAVREARRLFGDSADLFFGHRNELARMNREADQAVARAQEEIKSRQKEWEDNQKKQLGQYASMLEDSRAEIMQKTPMLQDKADDPDGNAALKKGRDWLAHLRENGDKMKPDEKAAHEAVLEARATLFHRHILEIQRRDKKITDLETELKQYRKSDPGEIKPGGDAGGKGADEVGGIDETAADMAKRVKATV